MSSVLIRDIAEVVGGGTPRKSVQKYFGGGIPWVTPKDMKRWTIGESEVSLTLEGVENSPAKIVPPGSVLLVVRSGVLKHTLPVAVTTAPVTLNQDMKALVPSEVVNGGYLARLVKARQAEVLGWVRATTADNFPIEMLLDLRIDLPPVDEQRRIAAILDQADALRAKRRQILAHLDALRQAIFHEMFSGEVATVELADVCRRITDGTHQPPEWTIEGIPFLFVTNIVSGEIDFSTRKHISEATWRELTRRTPIEVGDVLYSTVGSYGAPVVVRSERPFAFQRHIAHIKPDPRQVNSDFLSAQLASPALARQAKRAARGVAQPTVNLADIRKFRILVPSMQDQMRFATRISVVNARRLQALDVVAGSDRLFASLQYRSFRGEI